ncbi:selenide, water dikinase [Methylomusa anaerophila]|uniref:Selenide, water dikinase n=1 Tax=Methylomusa anaerophila TaxID=1930071 RepID=A0A348AHQ9_9FIRM|nr:selenide, water dikinase [Methylomusa anaerophila]
MVNHPNLLVGIQSSDDAGVYKLNDDTALVQTVDFFTPIVDDPYLFGQIAAANSLSDIYAMGAKPLTAMNIVAFPICSLPGDVLRDILRGGLDKINEAEAVMVGGHTVDDTEPKYGLSVTGLVHPDRVWTNAGAKPGDHLVLTKALGTGILATAARVGLFEAGVQAAVNSMVLLNRTAAQVASNYGIHACTDITGFGLLGHVYEMVAASGVSVEIYSTGLPLLPAAAEAAGMGLVPGGAYANREYLNNVVSFSEAVPANIQDICFDPQTSGGLLFSLPDTEAGELVEALKAAGITRAAKIGKVTSIGIEIGEGNIYVR